jgi:hypothetical protein
MSILLSKLRRAYFMALPRLAPARRLDVSQAANGRFRAHARHSGINDEGPLAVEGGRTLSDLRSSQRGGLRSFPLMAATAGVMP